MKPASEIVDPNFPGTGPLTRYEQEALVHLQAAIGRGLKNFVSCGTALLEIRDKRLYREKYLSFSEYCRAEWDMGKSYAYRLIAGASLAEQFPELDIKNEAQARALAERLERGNCPTTANTVSPIGDNMGTPSSEPKLTAKEAALAQIAAIAEGRWEAANFKTQTAVNNAAIKLALREGYKIDGKDHDLTDQYRERIKAELPGHAAATLEALEADPSLSATRAYAGIWGALNKGRERAAPKPGLLALRALKSFTNAIGDWDKFSDQEQASVARAYAFSLKRLPPIFRAAVAKTQNREDG
jgi:hypothetical protein